MKKICILFLTFLIIALSVAGVTAQNNAPRTEYLRIHIRANSNDEIDQSIKYKVKDAVVEAMIPLISSCQTKAEAEKVLEKNFPLIESVANKTLKENGFSYTSKAKLAREEFPTRTYESLTLEQGFYDALILNLGSGEGNNWWCVVYPPLCFLKANPTGNDAVYKSKIVEIIKSCFN